LQPPPLSSRKELLHWTLTVLKSYGIKPRKALSQNFVVEPRAIRDMLLHVDKYSSVIEVGAGIGTLSYFLDRWVAANKVFFEIDERLASIAVEYVSGNSIFVVGDALLHEWRSCQVVSNTPYHVTSEILLKLVKSNAVSKAVLMLQKDVVDRLTAMPGTREYGKLTIIVNVVFTVQPSSVYPPSSFYPSPEVASRIVVLSRRRAYDEEVRALEKITTRIFSKRRKRVYKVLKEEFGLSEGDLAKIGINPGSRVYELAPGDVLRIANYVKDYA